ncbi:hypothetical protein C8R43DRAFT_893174 [Mycena crocata]|nr:hypothetical protein C8R43DRAFT_893174 [Mycena crocata]
MTLFLAAMGGTSSYKQRLLNVVVEYVPVTFDPNRDGALHVVEGDNGYRSGSILKARYIKPVERRREGQTVAHVVFGFEATANAFLRAGMFVEGKRAFGRKLFTEPVRCLKCQVLGHVLVSCKSIHYACARCAGLHATRECTAADTERSCTNCRNAGRAHNGHGAADRACPVFAEKLQVALERDPGAKYPFFPVADDPESWVQHDGIASAAERESAGRVPEWQRLESQRGGRGPGLRRRWRQSIGDR